MDTNENPIATLLLGICENAGAIASNQDEQSGSVQQVDGLRGRRQITVSAEESDSIRYALCELAGRRAEQAIDYKEPSLAEEANNLRALAARIARESKQPIAKLTCSAPSGGDHEGKL